ncbi:polysaccharide pyruvyl transferase family protein [Rhodococcus hoagii]|uniref:Polysaccharide pyruvyl transferase family protein n=1 Tax=Rhodococcus hoagii TaxID=43767 RepID=A0AAE4ZKU6_RHOHA|nr:polysaccharide pyruvyl transferase family protein [Prescottella equi]
MTVDNKIQIGDAGTNDVPAKPYRVLVLWCDNTAANYGLRVLAQGNRRLVEAAFPDGTVEVDFQDFGPGESSTSFGTKAILRDLFRRNGPIKSKLRQYDLIVDSGAGDSFADIYGFKRLSFIVYAHAMIRLLRIPLMFGPQTIGPFDTRIGRLAARASLKQARLVIARDATSARFGTELGRPVDALATDVVFALDTELDPHCTSADILVNVSGLLWFGDAHGSRESYRAETLSLVESLLGANRNVALIAHVIHSRSGNDDVDASRAVAEAVRSRTGHAIDVLIPRSLSEARSVLGCAKVVVGSRMHACLNAISMGTPAVPWAYSRKFEPLMKALGWDLTIDLATESAPARRTIEHIDAIEGGYHDETFREVRSRADALCLEAEVAFRAGVGECLAPDGQGHAGSASVRSGGAQQ